jgi:asparagine synthase (glutamine-hydrolysing)
MCGFVGKVYWGGDRRVNKEDLERMHKKIEHRGPDDAGTYINPTGNVGLASRRLAIIDLSPAGHQPMSNADGTVWIAYNGEVYNFQSLRKDLEKKGYRFRSQSDTEVIIYLWEEYGVECLQFLRGMFAFALWDEQKKLLFMARDRVGKKPFKYYRGGNMLVFGSELKAFIDDPDVPREVDELAIHHYLAFQYAPHPMTGFKGIEKLPPAHYLLMDFSSGEPKVEMKRYWSLNYGQTLVLSEPEWEERILAKLEESVRLRLISDVPLGAFLSGGVDSSAVVAMMAKNSSRPVKTFSIGFTFETFNELPYAKQVAEQYGTEHQEFTVEPNAIELLPELVYQYEEPYADSSALPTYILSRMTREHVTVALNGDGGDENFAGYPWYKILKMAAHYRKVPRPLRQLLGSAVASLHNAFPSKLLRYGELSARGSLFAQSYLHTEILAYFNEPEKEKLYNKTFKEKTRAWPSEEYLERYYQRVDSKDPLSRALSTDMQSYLVDDLLVKVDIASMAHSLEARSPFLDHEFMEMAAQIPSNLKLRGGVSKYILKRAIKHHLPPALVYRKKQGFSAPIDHWFSTSLYDYAKEKLLEKNELFERIFDRQGLENIFKNREHIQWQGRQIWALLTLKLWYEAFFSNHRHAGKNCL